MNTGNNILVDFNMLIDTDIGMFNLIKDKYINSKCFNQNILRSSDINSVKCILLEERYNNILDLLINDEYDTVNLYNQLINLEYSTILRKSIVSELMNLINAYVMSNVINVTILCKNEQEEQIIKDINNKLRILIYEDTLDISEYDSIFLKKYEDIKLFKNIACKNIFISNHKNNIDEVKNIPLVDISLLIAKTNKVYIIDYYKTENPLG